EIQNILLNQNINNFATISDTNNRKSRISLYEDKFYLSNTKFVRNKFYKKDSLHKFLSINRNFEACEYKINYSKDNFIIKYSNFKKINHSSFPEILSISVGEKSDIKKLVMYYSSPIIREKKKQKFVIPDSYKQISNFL
ncbi:MAG: DUF4292 domain-containing protein, partial [Bacteroidota bacterium]|nr:DUF4292 domain-containing protein [Bacteroidota bacterium]